MPALISIPILILATYIYSVNGYGVAKRVKSHTSTLASSGPPVTCLVTVLARQAQLKLNMQRNEQQGILCQRLT
jgi:hypothetical protein